MEQDKANLSTEVNNLSSKTENLSKKEQDLTQSISKSEPKIKSLERKRDQYQSEIDRLTKEKDNLDKTTAEVQSKLSVLKNDLNLQEHGLYEPKYHFGTSKEYKDTLSTVRKKQKQMIKDKNAVVCDVEWTVSGSKQKGKTMTNKYVQLMLRAFNGECDSIINKVKYNNFSSIYSRINSAYTAVDKLGEPHHCRINHDYLELKEDELRLVHEYQEKVQEEKEAEREERERIKDEERAQKEIEKARIESEKEQEYYEKALEKARKEIGKATGAKQSKLEEKIAKLNEQLEEARENNKRAVSRAQLTKSGYVYIISNIGSFGENVYKVGMTRRLEPMQRIQELSGAAVPFRFDLHAMIFSENAPDLENLIHSKLKDRSVNKFNSRKEFFNVSLIDIQNIVKGAGFNTEFVEIPEAEEYRKTLALESETELESEI